MSARAVAGGVRRIEAKSSAQLWARPVGGSAMKFAPKEGFCRVSTASSSVRARRRSKAGRSLAAQLVGRRRPGRPSKRRSRVQSSKAGESAKRLCSKSSVPTSKRSMGMSLRPGTKE